MEMSEYLRANLFNIRYILISFESLQLLEGFLKIMDIKLLKTIKKTYNIVNSLPRIDVD